MLLENKKTGFGPTVKQLVSILEYNRTKEITKEELINIIRRYEISVSPTNLIYVLIKKRLLVKIKKNYYLFVPLRNIDNHITTSEFNAGIKYLGNEKYYLGVYSALKYHNLLTQMPNILFLFNTTYSGKKKILGYNLKYIKIKNEKFFGIIEDKYKYSDLEKTIIDSLYYNKLIKLNYVLELFSKAKYNKDKLILYAKKYNSVKVFKLVGILTNDKKYYDYLEQKGVLNSYTTIRNTGMKELIKEWKLRLI